MVGAITALDVALISAIAALVASIISPLTSWLVARAAHEHERAMRIREEKIGAYVRLLRECRRQQVLLTEQIRLLKELDAGRAIEFRGPAWNVDTFLDETAATLAFASDDVRNATQAFEELSFAIRPQDIDPSDPTSRQAFITAALVAAPKLQRRYEQLATIIRDELTR